MFENYRRAHVNPSRGKKRLAWNAPLPDQREIEERDLDQDGENWFKVTSSFGFRLPSTVLVEEVVVKDDVEMKKNTEEKKRAKRKRRQRGKGHKGKVKFQEDCDLGDGVVRRIELSTDGFWDFLSSDRWGDTCLLRVLPGELLDNLLFALYLLQKEFDVISYVTIAYLHNGRLVMPTRKNASIQEQNHPVDMERVLVQLDYFSPQPRSTKNTNQSQRSVASQEPSTDVKAERHRLPQVKCNIRGIVQPPPHSECQGPFHMVREPFLVRRGRECSAFPPSELPPLPGLSSKKEVWLDTNCETKGNKDVTASDNAFGPRDQEGFDMVAADLCLQRLPCISGPAASKQVTDKNPLAGGKKEKKKKGDDEEDSDFDEEEEFVPPVNLDLILERTENVLRELYLMDADLKPREPGRVLRGTGKELRKSQRKDVAVQVDFEAWLSSVSASSQQPGADPDPDCTKCKRWDTCPSFEEFAEYLDAAQQQEMLLANAKLKKDASMGKVVVTKSKTAIKQQSDTSEGRKSPGSNRSKVDISERELFASMGFREIFDETKLKSSYSFERMFAHKANTMPNYDKLLKVFSQPFKGKPKIGDAGTKGSAKAGEKDNAKNQPAWPQITQTETVCHEDQVTLEPSQPEQPPPPVVAGKLREFKFLKYRDYIPVPLGSLAEKPQNAMSLQEIQDRLLQAMKIFVVRKERATTSCRQFESRVSVTFTRRQKADGSGPFIADTCQVVAGVCRTLCDVSQAQNRSHPETEGAS